MGALSTVAILAIIGLVAVACLLGGLALGLMGFGRRAAHRRRRWARDDDDEGPSG